MDIDNYIYSHCTSPQLITIRDPYTHKVVTREVPCGKCYHCKMTRVNEWVTRMCLESQFRKYTYFVTLTYDSNTKCKIIEETHPVYHNINKRKTYGKHPLHICKKHLQNFIKRLRKNFGAPLKYFACGEYGHDYSRPHYHLILWSDVPLTRELIASSWSYLDSDKKVCPIGDIDYNDLVENGTLDSVTATHSFKYVCKYLNKRDYDIFNSQTKHYHYEYLKKNFLPHCEDFQHAMCEYRKVFNPFVLCSKQPAIGYDYFTKHVDEFTRGNLRLFGVKEKEFIFPRYFVRKTKEVLNPYKSISPTNQKPNTNAGIFSVYSTLVAILNTETYVKNAAKVARGIRSKSTYIFDNRECRLSHADFYDCLNHEHYQFNGVNYSVFRRKKFNRVCPIDEVLDKLEKSYKLLHDTILKQFYYSGLRQQFVKHSTILSIYGYKVDIPKDDVNYESACYDLFQRDLIIASNKRDTLFNERQNMYYQTKTTF